VTKRDATAVVQVEQPTDVAIESLSYDPEKQGRCTDEIPCHGLQVLMESSCLEHGGIVGIVQNSGETKPGIVGFIPAPDHRQGQLLAFNYCPCCGKGFEGRGGLVLGVQGPTLLQ
jgi:hypothetical protein